MLLGALTHYIYEKRLVRSKICAISYRASSLIPPRRRFGAAACQAKNEVGRAPFSLVATIEDVANVFKNEAMTTFDEFRTLRPGAMAEPHANGYDIEARQMKAKP